MARGASTKRSALDAEHLTARLRERGLEQLRDEDEVWAIVDPSDLRKPHAREMPALMRVRKTGGDKGTVPGYRTLNVLGVGRGGRRGILYHRLFSSEEDGFESEPTEVRAALETVGAALSGKTATYLLDSQFDDAAAWSTIWEQGQHLVCRLKLAERQVELPDDGGGWRPGSVAEAHGQARELARVRTELLVRKRGQRYLKRQPCTAIIAACPVRVSYPTDVRGRRTSPRRVKDAWVVVVRIEGVDWEPWRLLTDWPVADEAGAARAFRMYRQRWAVEDCFKFTKDVLGWEGVQLMDLEAIRTLVALGWVAAGFLYELGVTLEWPEVRLLGRLGGWAPRKDRPPGKTLLARGLRRLLDHRSTDAILRDEIARGGAPPPRLAALLGPAAPTTA
ncbi:MAG TPA: hypothetical protein VNA30_04790 [Mycobacteriales bacterium]|nr:hypothetical protein [Mycobacteriales bacterium]